MAERVYFIQAENGGPIKIGYSTDPEARVRALQPGHPERLVLRRSFPGGSLEEAALHRIFARYRLQGEWFSPVPLLAGLADAKAEDSERAEQEAWTAVERLRRHEKPWTLYEERARQAVQMQDVTILHGIGQAVIEVLERVDG